MICKSNSAGVNSMPADLQKFYTSYLQYAMKNGILDMANVQAEVENMKRQEILDKHTYSIWCGKDGKWYTYLPDETKERKKVLKKRTTEKEIQDVVIEYWERAAESKQPKTFRDVYFIWRETQDKLVSPNSVAKYETDYNRFFKDSDFADMNICDITDDLIKIFMVETIKNLNLCKESTRKLFGYVSNTILCARKHGIISSNPTEFLQSKDFYRYCPVKYKPVEKQIFVESDMERLQEQFQRDHEKMPDYIPTYAVELASLTGMRAGELAALRWDSITDECIVIDKSEKANRKKNEFSIDKTKNGKIRLFPMTDEIRNLLDRVWSVEQEYGYLSEWVFSNEKGRVHVTTISACAESKCRQLGIDKKGIYGFRKTFNSQLRCNGVSATVAASILGHTKEVNEQYYTFDTTDMKEKAEIVARVNAETVKR